MEGHINNIKLFKEGSAENKPKECVTTKNVLKKIETFVCNIFLLKAKKSFVAGLNIKKEQRLIMKNSAGDRVRKCLMCGRCRAEFILFSHMFLKTNSYTLSFNVRKYFSF